MVPGGSAEQYLVTESVTLCLAILPQVVTDLKLFMKNSLSIISSHLLQLIKTLVERAAM